MINRIIEILDKEKNLDIVETDYLRRKYLSQIKDVLNKGENPITFDKVTKAIDLSEKVKRKARDNLEKVIIANDEINVFLLGFRRYF